MKELLHVRIQAFDYIPDWDRIYKEKLLIVEIDDSPEEMILCKNGKCEEIVA